MLATCPEPKPEAKQDLSLAYAGDELLRQAAHILATSAIARRDARIQAGNLLHQFILARLRSGDGCNEIERREKRAVRSYATLDICQYLSMRSSSLNELLHISSAVNLLSSNGDMGSLSWSSIRPFRAFVHRKRGGNVWRNKGIPPAGYRTYSELEVWEIREPFQESAPALFREAVEQVLHHREIYRQANRLLTRANRLPVYTNARYAKIDRCEEAAEDQQASGTFPVATAPARDTAEYIVSLVRKAADRKELIRLLEAQLRRLTLEIP